MDQVQQKMMDQIEKKNEESMKRISNLFQNKQDEPRDDNQKPGTQQPAAIKTQINDQLAAQN